MEGNGVHFSPTKSRAAFFETKYVLCLFVILILSLIDGTMTIYLVGRGAREVNPVMEAALSVSNGFFLFMKYFLTAGGLFYLLLHGRRRVLKGLVSLEEIAGSLVLFYEGLVIYEITIYHLIK